MILANEEEIIPERSVVKRNWVEYFAFVIIERRSSLIHKEHKQGLTEATNT